MKKGAQDRNFRKIKNQISQIKEIITHSKTNALWEHEAAVRKKLRELSSFDKNSFKNYDEVYDEYVELLNYISERLLENYNNRNNTHFNLYDVLRDNFDVYIKSGIISVLVSEHIPKLISKEFNTIFPANPKNEYKKARAVKRTFHLHLGDTNTGKTYNSMMRLKEAKKGIYLSPLRILALENFERLNSQGIPCNLLTGEEEILVEGAAHTCCTIEKLDINEIYDIAIIDEIQMIKDDQRGAAWTRALLALRCTEIHICGALNAKELLIKIIDDCDDDYILKEYIRDLPLTIEDRSFYLKTAQEGDALVVFSKKRVLELAEFYSSMGIKTSVIYGDLPPEVRKKQYAQFIHKDSKVLISTDAIGMGVNLPIKRIIFMDIKKFDGNEVRYLNSQEVKQIGGRAGRKGIYNEGFIACAGGNQHFLRENISCIDDPIEEAVVGPSEEILKITSLPLREKLALWVTNKEKLPYYRKMDISEYIVLLDSIKAYKLDEIIQWKLMRIPFDISNADLMEAFLNYIDEFFVAKTEILSKPTFKHYELYELETYYQKINLYYSFSNVFNIPFDKDWIYSERTNVSENINNILLKI
jgi:ATP-dependent RNA helicase SUPV3L1/SUV3